MLCTTLNLQNIESPYKSTHINHPINKWVRESRANYIWTIKTGLALCKEFTYRRNKKHKCEEIIKSCKKVINKLSFIKNKKTSHPICMDDVHKLGCNVIASYRNYYINDKQYDKNGKYIFIWSKRKRPDWSYVMPDIKKYYLEGENIIYANFKKIKLNDNDVYDIEILENGLVRIYLEQGSYYIPKNWLREEVKNE